MSEASASVTQDKDKKVLLVYEVAVAATQMSVGAGPPSVRSASIRCAPLRQACHPEEGDRFQTMAIDFVETPVAWGNRVEDS